jgi:hypothetical protein
MSMEEVIAVRRDPLHTSVPSLMEPPTTIRSKWRG